MDAEIRFMILENLFYTTEELANKLKKYMCEMKIEINITWPAQRATTQSIPMWNTLKIKQFNVTTTN